MSESNQVDGLNSESSNCELVGNIILILSIVVGVVYIVAFGRVETVRYSAYAGAIEGSSWSFAQIIIGVSIGLSGLVWWYLFQKIASILNHLEARK